MAKKKEMDNLTRDVLTAQAAGLSYGKYKGLQHENARPVALKAPQAPTYPYEITCAICGKVFTAARKCRKYCSDYCRQTEQVYRMRRQREARKHGGQ